MHVTEAQIDEITQYWNEGVAIQAICEMIGLRPRQFEELKKTHLSHLEPRGRGWGGGCWTREQDRDPSIAEIQRRASEIRKRWTPEERASRFVGSAEYHHAERVSLQEERASTLPDRSR